MRKKIKERLFELEATREFAQKRGKEILLKKNGPAAAHNLRTRESSKKIKKETFELEQRLRARQGPPRQK